jgi:hypothetical protein
MTTPAPLADNKPYWTHQFSVYCLMCEGNFADAARLASDDVRKDIARARVASVPNRTRRAIRLSHRFTCSDHSKHHAIGCIRELCGKVDAAIYLSTMARTISGRHVAPLVDRYIRICRRAMPSISRHGALIDAVSSMLNPSTYFTHHVTPIIDELVHRFSRASCLPANITIKLPAGLCFCPPRPATPCQCAGSTDPLDNTDFISKHL